MEFLKKIVTRFLDEYGGDIHKIAFVFPTRRAGIFFLRCLQNQKGDMTAFWAPTIFSIEDFVVELSGLTILDQVESIFTLYEIYRQKVRTYPKSFEDFFSWGQMILADFNEIDKHLIDADKLFQTLKEYKTVEDINKEDKAEIYLKYTGFWDELDRLYREFNRVLAAKNRVYEGMAFRKTAGDIAAGKKSAAPWEKVIFCGFNALTAAESAVIRGLVNLGKGEIFWDMDRYFVEDVNQEAGYFFRQNKDIWGGGEVLWLENKLAQPKTIDIVGVQSKVSQAKVLGIKLQQLLASNPESEDIAVVLPDSAMLFPVLNSLPEDLERVNITIGFPLEQTPVFSLCDALLEMQVKALERGNVTPQEFYYKDALKVLNHPYIKPFAPDRIEALIKQTREENLVYIGVKEIAVFPQPLQDLFRVREDSGQAIEFLQELLVTIRDFYKEKKPDLFSIDYEYIYHFYALLNRLQDSLIAAGLQLAAAAFRQLFADIARNSRIPFTGEPLEGLQIMGVLETQTLNFTNLFVLSLNEGSLPPGRSQRSFIPYDVRCGFGLPTYKEQDAVSAYHFYRLLENSRHVTLLYTTEASGMEKNEKSRFIDQLLLEFAGKNPQAQIDHQVIDFSFSPTPAKELAVKKSAAIMTMLEQRPYSASVLLEYLGCSLRFYFSHILKLKEEEEIYESPDQRMVGDIIHKTLQQLYLRFCGQEKFLSFQDIEDIKSRLEPMLTTIYRETLKREDLQTGRNRIIFEVMRRFLNQFFEKEKQAAGFKIVMLEQEIGDVDLPFAVKGRQYTVRLVGHIDRVDIAPGNICRIIDYKTGKVNPLNIKSLEILSGPKAVDRREAFQLFFYRYLLKKSWRESGRFSYRLGIYPFKKMYAGLNFVKVDKAAEIDENMVKEFEKILEKIFQELFDASIPFSQTAEEKNCRYCPYIDLCGKSPALSF